MKTLNTKTFALSLLLAFAAVSPIKAMEFDGLDLGQDASQEAAKTAGSYVKVPEFVKTAGSYVKTPEFVKTAGSYVKVPEFVKTAGSYVKVPEFVKTAGSYVKTPEFVKTAGNNIGTKLNEFGSFVSEKTPEFVKTAGNYPSAFKADHPYAFWTGVAAVGSFTGYKLYKKVLNRNTESNAPAEIANLGTVKASAERFMSNEQVIDDYLSGKTHGIVISVSDLSEVESNLLTVTEQGDFVDAINVFNNALGIAIPSGFANSQEFKNLKDEATRAGIAPESLVIHAFSTKFKQEIVGALTALNEKLDSLQVLVATRSGSQANAAEVEPAEVVADDADAIPVAENQGYLAKARAYIPAVTNPLTKVKGYMPTVRNPFKRS